MFDKFGEFDSAAEINAKAKELLEKDDMNGLVDLALENGLDREDAEDFADGIVEELCTELQAALGKIKVEKEALKLERELADIAGEIEFYGASLAAGIRQKGKSLAEYVAKVIDAGYRNAVSIPREITDKLTDVPKQFRAQIKTGMPNKAERIQIMVDYFGGKVEK